MLRAFALGMCLLLAGQTAGQSCECNKGPINGGFFLSQTSQNCFRVQKQFTCEDDDCCWMDVQRLELTLGEGRTAQVMNVLKQLPLEDAEESVPFEVRDNLLKITEIEEDSTYCVQFLDRGSLLDSCGGQTCNYALFDSFGLCCPQGKLTGSATPPPDAPLPPSPLAPSVPPALRSPPPPPGNGFPYCQCKKTTSSFLRLVYTGQREGNLHCYNVTFDDGCPPDTPCCTFTVRKIEFDVDQTCTSSVRAFFVNGQQRAASASRIPGPVLKLTNVEISGPTEVCMRLSGPCTSLEQLCKGSMCRYSLFDLPGSKTSCCLLGMT